MSAFVAHDAHPWHGSRCLSHRPYAARFPPQGDGALVARSGATWQEHQGGSSATISRDGKHALSVLAPCIRSWAIVPQPTDASHSHISSTTRLLDSRTGYPKAPGLRLLTQFELRRVSPICGIAPPKALGPHTNRHTTHSLSLSSRRGADRVPPTP